MLALSISLTVWSLFVGGTDSLDIGNCRAALGMQTGEISDEFITASSSFDPINVGPPSSRIRTEVNGGAWCPKEQVSPSVHEYLQIDLGALKVITLVETQGRFGNGQGQEYMEQYKLEYQREEFGPWFKFQNRRGQEIFQGNSNTYIAELREVDPPIIARRIRFVPYSSHSKHVCMRAEVYGCDWKDGVISYSMPQGDRRSADIDLFDSTYDGLNKDNFLAGGLGQLMDGDEGQSNFRHDTRSLGIRGYEWVGWKNESHPGGSVEITFVFDAVRNFTGLRIHCNNMFSRDVRVFRMARVYFSVGGSIYSQEPIQYTFMMDSLIEYARTVYIHLNHRVGRYVKVQLLFESRWIMISEVEFLSEYAIGLILPETAASSHNHKALVTLDSIGSISSNRNSSSSLSSSSMSNGHSSTDSKNDMHPFGHELSFDDDGVLSKDSDPARESPPLEADLDPPSMPRGRGDEYVGIVVGAVVTFFLVSFAFLVLFLWRRRSRGKYSNSHRVMKCSGEGNGAMLYGNQTQDDSMENSSRGKRPACNQGTRKKTGSASRFLFGRFRGEENLPDSGEKTTSNMYNFFNGGGGGGGSSDIDSDQACCGGVSNASIEFNFFRDPAGAPPGAINVARGHTSEGRRLPELPQSPDSSDTYASKEYFGTSYLAHPAMINSQPIGCRTLQHAPPSYLAAQSASRAHAPYNSATLRQSKGQNRSANQIQGEGFNSSGASFMSGIYSSSLENPDVTVLELPSDKLKFIKTISTGRFSQVRLCEVCDATSGARNSPLPILVAKIITCSLTDIERENVEEDISLMARLQDPNIVRLLAASSCRPTAAADSPAASDSLSGSCRCLLMEYMCFGNLRDYMKGHVQECSTADSNSLPVLSYGAQIYIMSQISSGMKYLETRNLVHRGLSASTCLVGPLHSVKISCTFPLKQSLSSRERREQPTQRSDREDLVLTWSENVRWMAWETALMGQYSMKSDVWAFGMTMWEVLTVASHAPLEDCLPTLSQMYDNFNHYYQADGEELYPPQPSHCAREIYDLMRECWNREESCRPAFREIHMFLKRKNMGYDPRQDSEGAVGAAAANANSKSATNGFSIMDNMNPVVV